MSTFYLLGRWSTGSQYDVAVAMTIVLFNVLLSGIFVIKLLSFSSVNKVMIRSTNF